MSEFFEKLFSSEFMPHGHCLFWQPSVLWLHVSSDALIALAYYSIPIALLTIVRKRTDLAYDWMFILFAAFIFLCGTTHVFGIWSMWHGTYRLEGLVKLLTALVSISTAALLWPLIPRILKIPSSKQLQDEVDQRKAVQAKLEVAQSALEQKVEERTEELARANQHLKLLADIVETSDDAIVSVTVDHLISSWNSSAERIFGFSNDEIVGKKIDQVINENTSWKHYQSLVQKVIGGEALSDVDTVWNTKDGKDVAVSITASPVLRADTTKVDGASLIIRDISERIEAKKRLESSLDEKEILLKEIHHRVKNNLQVISSLLRLQSRYLEDPIALSMFRESEERVRSMALVHDKLYRSKSLSRIEFKSYVEELTNELCRTYALTDRELKTDIAINEFELSIEKAIPCGLILNELVSNALKHAFTNGHGTDPALTISLKSVDSEVELIVSDNGSGLPPQFNIENAESMGLRVVQTLCEQLEGTIEILRQNGTTFRLQFPVHA